MRQFPEADAGEADHRSPSRFLLWIARTQWRTMALAIAAGTVWMISQALMPATIGMAIDDGLVPKNTTALLTWAGVLFALGVIQAAAGITRHRFAVVNWLGAAYRTVQVVTRQATRLGATLPKRLSTGEVVSVGTSDIAHIGGAMDITARGTGAVVAIVTISVIMLNASPTLGLVVIVGVPLIAAAVGPILRPLHRRQHRQRELQAELTTRAGDIVAGLRVLRGIGGEQVFADRYREESQRVRRSGVRVASVDALLEGAQVLLPGLLIAPVTWIGARFAVQGTITAGELVAFYGYAVFLSHPLVTLMEAADKLTKGHVSARRVVRILSMTPELGDARAASAPSGGELIDRRSGLLVAPGRLTAVACAASEDGTAIADRLGRYVEGEVMYGGARLRDLSLRDVRNSILVAGNDARLFSGLLRDELDPSGTADARGIAEALHTACAQDIIEALPAGLDEQVAEAGGEFSGGQQQRLKLTRALLRDPEVLVLIEPTSAVDAHTEARIASRLGVAREGRTTVVFSTSPLLLDQADHVVFVAGGMAVAEGAHRDLLTSEPAYAAAVTRGEDA